MAFGNNGQPRNQFNNAQNPYGQQPYAQQNYQNYQQPQYGNPYGQQQYGQQYGNPYGQPQYAQNSYGTAAYGQPVMDAQATYTQENYLKATRVSTAKAYGEMTAGLLVTAVVALLTQATGLLYTFLMAFGSVGLIGLAIVQVGLAVVLGWKVMSMNPTTARVMFYVYAALMGFTLSSIFAVYSLGSIVLVLAMTAGFFLCLTMVALTTKADLLKAGPILMVALIVLIVAELIMMFVMPGQTATMVISAIALVIFAGLTAYDAQFTRALFQQYAGDATMIKRVSILCALNLYLDFINFFLNLLQLLGSRE
ncbi:Bax inhibitor-1/YccA family protein [Bifidobacterium callimiconis]|uniref:Inhibitor of apoptosis-promoting Bax1 n=1 Tax=Bifidobacterium callimiconis TaxID=2306973 RepID=A0A430FD46_9BIFI|nr:Bax inhibitor-1/YccA family protein [Bifidobacterium callimiconis]RSX50708.1 Inhibitor of apoptosis-promoting Bax1 [Bifidobacterium callimiconis]